MFRRRPPVSHRGPGLAQTVARTAVIAGTATATSNAVAGKQAARQQAAAQHTAQQQHVEQLTRQVEHLQAQAVQSQVLPPSSPDAIGDDMISQLARLGELHQQGILSAEEFVAAKARLLNG